MNFFLRIDFSAYTPGPTHHSHHQHIISIAASELVFFLPMSSSSVPIVEPQEFADPVVTQGLTRDCAVMDQSGNVQWVRCLISQQSGLAYTFIRTLRECIYGVVRHAITLSQRDGIYHYHYDRQVRDTDYGGPF